VPIPGPAHDAILTVIDCLPPGTLISAALVAWLLGMSEAEAARLLDELVAARCLVSAVGPLQ
jgi:hypothetical protein